MQRNMACREVVALTLQNLKGHLPDFQSIKDYPSTPLANIGTRQLPKAS